MIESYLRSNKMFVDYSEVRIYFFVSLKIRSIWSLFSNLNLNGLVLQPQEERAYTSCLELDLGGVEPCISGPKRYMLLLLQIITYFLHI